MKKAIKNTTFPAIKKLIFLEASASWLTPFTHEQWTKFTTSHVNYLLSWFKLPGFLMYGNYVHFKLLNLVYIPLSYIALSNNWSRVKKKWVVKLLIMEYKYLYKVYNVYKTRSLVGGDLRLRLIIYCVACVAKAMTTYSTRQRRRVTVTLGNTTWHEILITRSLLFVKMSWFVNS